MDGKGVVEWVESEEKKLAEKKNKRIAYQAWVGSTATQNRTQCFQKKVQGEVHVRAGAAPRTQLERRGG